MAVVPESGENLPEGDVHGSSTVSTYSVVVLSVV